MQYSEQFSSKTKFLKKKRGLYIRHFQATVKVNLPVLPEQNTQCATLANRVIATFTLLAMNFPIHSIPRPFRSTFIPTHATSFATTTTTVCEHAWSQNRAYAKAANRTTATFTLFATNYHIFVPLHIQHHTCNLVRHHHCHSV